MAQRKPYNPNTNYGRKKLREQAQQEYNKLSPAEKEARKIQGFVIGLVILIVIGILVYLAQGSEGLAKWMSR